MKKTSSIFFLFFTLSIFSQKITVINGETGKAIDAVAIYNKAKTASSVTNEAGVVEMADFKNEEIIWANFYSRLYLNRRLAFNQIISEERAKSKQLR